MTMVPAVALGENLVGSLYRNTIRFDSDTVISRDVVVIGENIFTDHSIVLQNLGYVYGTINVCDNCRLVIQNSGTINARYNLGDGAQVSQIIQSVDDITDIGVVPSYNLVVNASSQMLNLGDISAIGRGAKQIVLDNANLYLSAPITDAEFRIQLVGETSLYLSGLADYADSVILKNVVGNGTVRVISDDIDALFAVQTYLADETLRFEIVRETDYQKIFKNDVGAFLNELRRIRPGDKTLAALDRATNMDELNNIMLRSARIQPMNMMRPIILMNALMRDWWHRYPGGEILTVFSDDFDAMGAGAGVVFDGSNNTFVGLDISAFHIEYEDDINVFDAQTFSANMRVAYAGRWIALRAATGATVALFDSGPVFDGRGVVQNPIGLAAYVSTVAGVRLMSLFDIDIMPFVGADGSVATVLNKEEFDYGARGGIEFNIQTGLSDLEYNYSARLSVSDDGEKCGALVVAVWSPADGAGGALSVDVVDGDYGRALKLGLHAAVVF